MKKIFNVTRAMHCLKKLPKCSFTFIECALYLVNKLYLLWKITCYYNFLTCDK